MIDWEKEAIHPPPILQEITDDDLICGIEKMLQIPSFLCHTQNVECGMKIVTEASSKVFGYEARYCYILTTLHSRSKLAKIDTKGIIKFSLTE